ncbi:hypothetical protein E3N88_25730 [Mikania micrantha]|uniref:J domain-containing protein n=1 Tax=Mikania micrantha TaxID=192012 RepID=A0A5N6N8B4_9ASTR|nr:hypothetical protein E3N88_25730 [Mikania micrantha]
MESLSRPFHSRKLSNTGAFSNNKNAYADVFSGNRRKFTGASAIDVQEYSEIFGSSQASSIPVIDLSTLRDPPNGLSQNFQGSNPDYSKIFGGFRNEGVAVSYEELFVRDKSRAPSSATSTSQDSDNLSHQSPDGLKQFNMSYNKISPKSKDGLDGTTNHVTQLPAVTGFTCFVDERVTQAEKQNSSAVNANHISPKKSSTNAVRKDSNHAGSIPIDKKLKTFDVGLNTHPSAVSSSVTNADNHNNNPRKSMNSESCKIDFDENLDMNSAASAALKKAIEKAQESIRIAKESVGRKKNGLRSFSKKKSKNSSKIEGVEDVTAGQEKNCRDEDPSQIFQDVGRNHKYGEKLLGAKKFIDQIHEKILESVKDSKIGNDTVVYNTTRVTSETESKPFDSPRKDEYETLCSEAVDTETSKIQISEFVHEFQTDNMIVDEHEAGIKMSTPNVDILEHQSIVKELESDEINDEVRLSNTHEIIKELSNLNMSQKEKDDSEASQDFNQKDDDKQENVFEHNDSENAESEKHEEIEEASESVKSENESKHNQNYEIHMDEETSEMFDDFSERKAEDSVESCDNSLEKSDQSAESYNINKLEESEVNLHEDCEIKQQDNQNIDEKSSGDDDDDIMEEPDDIDCIQVASNIVEKHDINVETTRVVDDVTEASSEFQAEETDQTSSDDNEDEQERRSEENSLIDSLEDLGSENDVISESSSGSTHSVKILETTNEIKDSQEPESSQKQDEIEEPGPSKLPGEDRFRRIDEEQAAKEREWERNRLAVDRAIREARERAFAEARERAERERAAVEKATEEVRQRMMAEAHEKVSKSSVMNRSSSEKSSAESKLRAERAAVERATSEARQRALEKAISQKNASDLNRSESALRTKVKLEKHNRIMERAAKALAEKEKRDRLAQKEQAERNRLAENLDADIKRWSNGKEGNLRALLSTLQYILGPGSGWQPVSLTDIITTSAVKKAYRKATLCVHPDKLQQRGATIQHKRLGTDLTLRRDSGFTAAVVVAVVVGGS